MKCIGRFFRRIRDDIRNARLTEKALRAGVKEYSRTDWPFNFDKADIRVRNEMDKDKLVPSVRFTHSHTGTEVVRDGELLQTLGDIQREEVWIEMHQKLAAKGWKGPNGSAS